MSKLTYEETMLVRRALGMTRSATVNRNRVACHVNGQDIFVARTLANSGVMVRDASADYGSMLVFRVTTEGAKAIGKTLRTEHRFAA